MIDHDKLAEYTRAIFGARPDSDIEIAGLISVVSKRDWRTYRELAAQVLPFYVDANKKLEARVARLEGLVRTMVDNDPDDMAADSVTVLDVWRKEARAALGKDA
ncbi:MAG: hypothetical protein VW338_14555 [Rhodospirillaceae bacterium]